MSAVRLRERPVRPDRMNLIEWLVPLGLALVLLGPALAPGVLLNLDLVLVPHLDTPSGFWGLGPELPRRLSMWLPISWLSPVIPATLSGKLLMVALFVVSWTGMARLTRRIDADASMLTSQAAAALYTLSPFVLTRIAVGHFMVTWPHAMLPWVLPILVRPGRRLGSTFLACLLLGFAGHFAGSVAMTVVAVAVLVGHRERWLKALLVAAAAQAPWLVPGLVVAATNEIDMAGGDSFPTVLGGGGGLFRLSAGGGFWNTYFQIGEEGLIAAAAGLVLLALAITGTRSIQSEFRRPMAVLGVVGWFVAAASAIPVLSTGFFWIDEHLLGGIWREPHRVLTLHLLWLAPAAALGSRRVHRACLGQDRWIPAAGPALVLPFAVAAALAMPALWGLGGQLSAEPLPSSWREAREEVRAAPGTVLALPWYQYFNVSVSGGPMRRVLNPLPLYLGGDVLSSSDNSLQPGVREFGDPREAQASAAVERLLSGAPISDDLAALGVRWVVVLDTPVRHDYSGLNDDAGLRRVIDGDGLWLHEVVNWPGPAVTTSGAPVPVATVVPAWARIESGDDVLWSRAGSGGWWRGWSPAQVASDGRVLLPAGTAPVWHVGALPSLTAQFVPWTIAVVLVVRRRRAGEC
jgi:hypothetical protein